MVKVLGRLATCLETEVAVWTGEVRRGAFAVGAPRGRCQPVPAEIEAVDVGNPLAHGGQVECKSELRGVGLVQRGSGEVKTQSIPHPRRSGGTH